MKKKSSNGKKIFGFILIIILAVLIVILKKYDSKLKQSENQYSEIENKYNIQTEKVSKLKSELSTFVNTGIMQDDENNFVYLSNVPIINQFPKFPTGCESIALQIILKNYDIDVTGYDIINLLNKEERPYYKNGVRYGGNPKRGFLGDPTKTYGYGVYEQPIIDVANKIKPGIIDATGTELNEILKVIANGNPVQTWGSIDMKDAYYSTSWLDCNTGEKINWPKGFHSLVIVGYDNEYIFASDPDTGTVRGFERAQFEKVYNFQGKRAIYYEN